MLERRIASFAKQRHKTLMVWRRYEAGEYTRSENLQRNEKIKTISSIATNGGLGLFAAGLARWFYEGVDGHAVLWLSLGAAAMWVGVHLLTQLEADG